jgi:hypothetical protein
MSAINVFAFEKLLVFPRTCCECVRPVAEDAIQNSHEPVVSRKWAVEMSNDGTRRLAAHWFKNW